MRRLNGKPRATDFVPAREYEASTPAAFGLPEVPVLYAQCQALRQNNVTAADLWIASDGLYVWNKNEGLVHDIESVKLSGQQLHTNNSVIDLDAETAQTVAYALDKAIAFNSIIGAQEDNIEIAVPLEYETGQADDLGDARLEHSIGMGLSLSSGPAIAAKRRRSS